jgi:membrane protein DedA with SNARE-associated domain
MTALLFYAGILALLTLEEAGVFLLPGDISLVAAGLQASQGGSVLVISWVCASTGMVVGSTVLFHAVGTSERLERVMPDRVVNLVKRHHVWGVFLARLVPGLRNATVFAASASNLPYRVFLWGLVPAALIWSGFLLLAGYFGGSAMLSLFGELHHSRVLKIVSIALLLGVAVALFVRLQREGRNETPKGHVEVAPAKEA